MLQNPLPHLLRITAVMIWMLYAASRCFWESSFTPPCPFCLELSLIWGVEDIYASDAFGLRMHLIHGWRMQLFFFISGFFTMMLQGNEAPMHLLCTELNAFSHPRGRDVHHHPRVDDRSDMQGRMTHGKPSGNFPVAPMHQKENQIRKPPRY